ncbi:hypothetical protein Pyn_13845 [Prunus yedoensis var. nudiflora]|uniref:Uncharacterized protein n=1 Tax=Prunus yedoensis var. nudiflora TaxID=2094558 RepID=A0A314Z940_PRUYE|nr:hypothetical protein Pyn_13845 [Prunus yedoensis var. nudiflora]
MGPFMPKTNSSTKTFILQPTQNPSHTETSALLEFQPWVLERRSKPTCEAAAQTGKTLAAWWEKIRLGFCGEGARVCKVKIRQTTLAIF